MKKTLIALLGLILVLCMAVASAETAPTATEVWASPDSPTGYYVTFRYAGEAERVRLQGQWTFRTGVTSTAGVEYFQPVDWAPNMFVDGNFDVYEMAKNENGVFEYTLPLPNGTFSYWYFLNGDAGTETADLTGAQQSFDPSVAPIISEDANPTNMSAGSNRSHIYVPLDATKCFDDRTVEAPRTDGIVGTIEYATVIVPSEEGDITEPFGIYLPYGFDANRETPYKVVVLSHGNNGDQFNWPNNGCAKNILDNLYNPTIADTVWVFPNNTVYKWNLELIHTSVVDYILPYMVANYNVSEKVEDRVFAGLSMGGMTTTYMLTYHTTDFCAFYPMSGSNFGIWQYNDTVDFEAMKNVKIGIHGAYQAFDFNDLQKTIGIWNENGLTFGQYFCDGGHTWEVWRKHLEYMVKNELWQ